MFNIRSAATVAAVTFGALFASPLSAQSSSIVKTKGLMIGAHVGAASVTTEDEDNNNSQKERSSGVGGGLQIGWGFTKWLMLYGGVDAAKMEIKGLSGIDDDDFDPDFTLVHADIGVRFSFPSPNHGFAPYVNVAATGRAAGATVVDEDVSISGAGVSFGAGLMYFFNPKWALDLGLQVTSGKFNTVEVGGIKVDLEEQGIDVERTNSGRINVGVKFFPHFGNK